MKSEELLALTASEPLSMDEEMDMQRKTDLMALDHMTERLIDRQMASR